MIEIEMIAVASIPLVIITVMITALRITVRKANSLTN